LLFADPFTVILDRSVGPLDHDFQVASLDSGPEHFRHFRFLVGDKLRCPSGEYRRNEAQ